jgi:Cu/Ag efflux pump CusA
MFLLRWALTERELDISFGTIWMHRVWIWVSRELQDWYIKFALQNVQGVADVASYGGFQRQYQIVLAPHKLTYYNLQLMDVLKTKHANNNDVGGGKF